MLKFALLAISLSIFAGSASTIQYVKIPDQNIPIEDTTKCRIYVYRPTTFGYAVQIPITDSNNIVGKTGPNGYLCWERSPGTIIVEGRAENTSAVSINAQNGKAYYVLQDIRMGILSARTDLEIVEPARGKEEIINCSQPKYTKK